MCSFSLSVCNDPLWSFLLSILFNLTFPLGVSIYLAELCYAHSLKYIGKIHLRRKYNKVLCWNSNISFSNTFPDNKVRCILAVRVVMKLLAHPIAACVCVHLLFTWMETVTLLYIICSPSHFLFINTLLWFKLYDSIIHNRVSDSIFENALCRFHTMRIKSVLRF